MFTWIVLIFDFCPLTIAICDFFNPHSFANSFITASFAAPLTGAVVTFILNKSSVTSNISLLEDLGITLILI